MLLDRSFSASGQVADRQDALQRGRQAMELMTRQLRSQVCVGTSNHAAGQPANDNSRDLLRGPEREPQNVKKRTLTLRHRHGRAITENVIATPPAGPTRRWPSPARRPTTTLLTKVKQIRDGARPAARPVFRYYRYKPGTPVGDLEQLAAPVAAHQPPTRRRRSRSASASYAQRPISEDSDSTELEDDVYIAHVGPERAAGGPTMRLIHRCQQGFTTVTLMGVLMVGGLLVAASFAAVNPDIGFTKKDDDSKQAYAAAEAGHQLLPEPPGAGHELLHALHERPRPRAQNAGEPASGTARGADPRLFRKIPGHHVRVRGRAARRPEHERGRHRAVRGEQPASMIDAKTGAFRIRATGRARTPKNASDKPRSAASSPRCGARPSSTTSTSPTARRSTRSPTADSADQAWAGAQLRRAAPVARRAAAPRSTSSRETRCNGPLHTNDSILVCGSPNFGVTTRTTRSS